LSCSGWSRCSGDSSPDERTEGTVLDLDRALAGDSALHLAEPRLKLVGALAGILALSLLPVAAWIPLLIAWIVLVAASASAGLGSFRLTRAGFIAAPFLLAALPLVFTRSGDPLGTLPIGPVTLTVSGEGLRLFATIALKSWLSVQVALLLTFTTPFHDLVDALRRLRLPAIMVGIISFMYRYLAVLADEAGRLARARASRSADPTGRGGGTIRWRAGVTGAMVGTLFIRSYERSERIYHAMQARGFEGTLRNVHGRDLRPAELASFAAFIIGLVVFEAAAHLGALG
jgi:cobalt/nickel transport system permease protein